VGRFFDVFDERKHVFRPARYAVDVLVPLRTDEVAIRCQVDEIQRDIRRDSDTVRVEFLSKGPISSNKRDGRVLDLHVREHYETVNRDLVLA
jgi:hypothetical protein